jgi:two-component system phosphate regulon sensor histidine kinase PhoR
MLYGLERRQGLRRSYIILPLVSLLSLFALSIALASLTRNIITTSMERQLSQTNTFFSRAMIREAVHYERSEAWDVNGYISELAMGSPIRITVMNLEGIVIADNFAETEKMDNHLTRPEMISAIQGKPRFVTRYSATLEYPLMYHAVRFTPGGPFDGDLVLRTSIPMVSIRELLYLGYRVIAMFTLFLMIVSGIIIVYQIRGIRAPIDKILKAAEQIEQNEWELDLYILRPYEFARIAQAIKSLAKTLREQIDSLRQQNDDLQRILNIQRDSVIVLDQYQQIISCNAPAVTFLASEGDRLFSDETDDGMGNAEDRHSLIQKRFAKKSLMTFVRSSELNRIFEEARSSGEFRRGVITVYHEQTREYECYVTPFSGSNFEGTEDVPQQYLLVVYSP